MTTPFATSVSPPTALPTLDSPASQTSLPVRSWWQSYVRWRNRFANFITTAWAVYILSIGPLFWQWYGAMHAAGPEWLARLYYPLALAGDLVPPLGWLLNWYVNLWIL